MRQVGDRYHKVKAKREGKDGALKQFKGEVQTYFKRCFDFLLSRQDGGMHSCIAMHVPDCQVQS